MKDDMANGKGRFKQPDGAFYDGNWVDDQQHGEGQENST